MCIITSSADTFHQPRRHGPGQQRGEPHHSALCALTQNVTFQKWLFTHWKSDNHFVILCYILGHLGCLQNESPKRTYRIFAHCEAVCECAHEDKTVIVSGGQRAGCGLGRAVWAIIVIFTIIITGHTTTAGPSVENCCVGNKLCKLCGYSEYKYLRWD